MCEPKRSALPGALAVAAAVMAAPAVAAVAAVAGSVLAAVSAAEVAAAVALVAMVYVRLRPRPAQPPRMPAPRVKALERGPRAIENTVVVTAGMIVDNTVKKEAR